MTDAANKHRLNYTNYKKTILTLVLTLQKFGKLYQTIKDICEFETKKIFKCFSHNSLTPLSGKLKYLH